MADAMIEVEGASCALWWQGEVPRLRGEWLGAIGAYRAEGEEAGRLALEAACDRLRAVGCTLAVGPMDGNTWRRYRFVTGGDPDEPPFFLEPTNPPEYPAHWEAAGFSPLARYVSSLTRELAWHDPRAERVAARLAAAGMTVRNLGSGEEDLRAIYRLSLTSFADNFLYTPLGEDEFLEQYRRLLPIVAPELTFLAHAADGALVGFLFAVPDRTQGRTVIVKTAAVSPGRAWAGLGMLLLERCHKAAQGMGYSRAIHALMHQSNASRNVSGGHGARCIREYTLFSRRLSG